MMDEGGYSAPGISSILMEQMWGYNTKTCYCASKVWTVLLQETRFAYLLLFSCAADGCRHWERYNGAMEAQAQWAAKLLQEYQRRAEACGFPGPHAEVSQPNKDSPAKTVQGGISVLM